MLRTKTKTQAVRERLTFCLLSNDSLILRAAGFDEIRYTIEISSEDTYLKLATHKTLRDVFIKLKEFLIFRPDGNSNVG